MLGPMRSLRPWSTLPLALLLATAGCKSKAADDGDGGPSADTGKATPPEPAPVEPSLDELLAVARASFALAGTWDVASEEERPAAPDGEKA